MTPADIEEAHRYLEEPLRPLFASMMVRDQQHGLIVMRRVRTQAGESDAQLLAAALIHDCGKGRVHLWQRVAHVLMGALAPGTEQRIANETGPDWRRGFWRLLHHPELGARMAEAAGAHPDVARMIREQDAPSPDARLAILQAADEA
jgi:hypothetical protein